MLPFLYLLGILALAVDKALAIVDGLNAWKYPGPAGGANVDWIIGEKRPLEWYTNLTSYNVTLWQNRKDTFPLMVGVICQSSALPNDGTGNQSFNWAVSASGIDLGIGTNFFLWGGWSTDPEVEKINQKGFTSWSFDMVYEPVTSSSSTSSTSSSAPASSTSASTSSKVVNVSATDTASPIEQNSDRSQNNNDSSTAIGAGVGAGVGGLLLLTAGAFFGFKYAKRRSIGEARASPNTPMLENFHGYNSHGDSAVPLCMNDQKPSESTNVSHWQVSTHSPAELPGHDGRPHELRA